MHILSPTVRMDKDTSIGGSDQVIGIEVTHMDPSTVVMDMDISMVATHMELKMVVTDTVHKMVVMDMDP